MMVRLRLVAGRGAISACSSRTSQSAAAAVAMTAVTVPCLGRAASRALCSLVRPAWRAPRPRAAWSSARRTGSCQRWRIQSLDPIHCCETYVVRAWGWHSRAWGSHSCAWDSYAFALVGFAHAICARYGAPKSSTVQYPVHVPRHYGDLAICRALRPMNPH